MLIETTHDQILELRLNRPPVNAIDPGLLRELHDKVRKIHSNQTDIHALVISGSPGIFSAGLDVPALLKFGRDEMSGFWAEFFSLWKQLATLPVPVAVAMTGHSPAGGTVLSLFCDYRVLAEGDFKVGLNEVQVGLVAPSPIVSALQRLVGVRAAERHLVAGDLIGPGAALEIGLVDELAPPDQVVESALAWCRKHLQLPRHAMLASRQLARADLHRVFEQHDAGGQFIDQWFAPQTQQVLQALAARLQGG